MREWMAAGIGVLALGAMAPGVMTSAVNADPIEDFYKAKGLTIYVGSDPGGGYDTYGRLVARQIARFMPGNPAIVVKNMTGASGMRLANFMYAKAERTVPRSASSKTPSCWSR